MDLASRQAANRLRVGCSHPWPFLPGPAAIAGLVICHYAGLDLEGLQVAFERIAPIPLGAAAAIYAFRTVYTRSRAGLIVTFLVISLLCREIHFPFMDYAIFALLGIAGLWALWWRADVLRVLSDGRHTWWFAATMATYFLSQLIAKRVFAARHLPLIPDEGAIHTALEEGVETVGHLMLLFTSMVGRWRRGPAEPKESDSDATVR